MKKEKLHTHEAYSDESSHNQGFYGAISLISLEKELSKEMNNKIKSILETSNVAELKWNKIRSAKHRYCAFKVIDYLFSVPWTNRFRIDVVIWNIQERKRKYSQDDIASLKRMYHHIFKNIVQRWPNESSWKFFPDRHTEIDWKKTEEILN